MAVTPDRTTSSPARPVEEPGVDRGDGAVEAPAAQRTPPGERERPLRWRSGAGFPSPAATTVPGPSLARPPALALGTILLAAGLYFLYRQHTFTPLSNFPGGAARTGGNAFLGIFGANGWTGMLTAIAGGLLMFGAAQHLLAKTMSLIVALALGAAAIIALVRHGNVLGLAAANGWTELGWGASALILLANSLMGRVRRTAPLEPGAAPRTPEAGTRERGGRPGAGSDPATV